jgi:GntR family transcriptional regulator
MFDQVNIYSSVAAYAQIENLVRFAVASGRLKAGERLPAVRELADQSGLNANTITKAYRDLEVMGVVYMRRGVGVFIKDGAQAKCREAVRCEVAGRLHEIVSEALASGMSGKEVRALLGKLYRAVGEPYAVNDEVVRKLAKGE